MTEETMCRKGKNEDIIREKWHEKKDYELC